MSRIGKKAVAIPSGVTASVEGQTVKMKGPKGALQFVVPDEIVVKMDKGTIKVDPRSDTKRALSMWGTSRTLVANLVAGLILVPLLWLWQRRVAIHAQRSAVT